MNNSLPLGPLVGESWMWTLLGTDNFSSPRLGFPTPSREAQSPLREFNHTTQWSVVFRSLRRLSFTWEAHRCSSSRYFVYVCMDILELSPPACRESQAEGIAWFPSGFSRCRWCVLDIERTTCQRSRSFQNPDGYKYWTVVLCKSLADRRSTEQVCHTLS